jgi:hydroxymethylpyrimidine/phosphomethylpyrimidine kinase
VREASKLLGDVSLLTISDMRNAAESIYKLGPKYVFSTSVNLFFFICSLTLHVRYHILVRLILNLYGGMSA